METSPSCASRNSAEFRYRHECTFGRRQGQHLRGFYVNGPGSERTPDPLALPRERTRDVIKMAFVTCEYFQAVQAGQYNSISDSGSCWNNAEAEPYIVTSKFIVMADQDTGRTRPTIPNNLAHTIRQIRIRALDKQWCSRDQPTQGTACWDALTLPSYPVRSTIQSSMCRCEESVAGARTPPKTRFDESVC